MQPLDGLRRIWFEIGATQQYDPLGHTEFWVQHRLWGDDTLGYHLVNISLHLTTALTEWRRDVAPLSPLLALGLGAGFLMAWVEQTFVIGGHAVHFGLGPLERVLLAGRAFWFYLGKPFWPAGLVFFHPRWDFSDVESWASLFPVAAVALAIGAWAFRGRGRGPLAALLFFFALLPALGFIDVYPFRYSDVPASAYAESGRFGDAAATASAALDLARGAGLDPLAVEIESRLDLYRSGRPFHASGR